MAKSLLSTPRSKYAGQTGPNLSAPTAMNRAMQDLDTTGADPTVTLDRVGAIAAENNLTMKQAAFVDVLAAGSDQQTAARAAYGANTSVSTANATLALPKIKQALINERAKNAHMLGLTRDKVLQGFMDAVDQAKMLADPMSQIAGWREIAKVCGFYAPEVRRVELTGNAKRIVDRMQSLSDEELMQIAQAEDIEFVERVE